MHLDTRVLRDLIALLVQQRLSDRELSQLVRMCTAISASILRHSYRRHLILLRDRYMPGDLAVRCIEDLFLPRGGIRCNKLYSYFSELDSREHLVHAEHTFSHLRMVIAVNVRQTIPDLLAERDPVFSKILRAVHGAVRTHPDLHEYMLFNDRLIVLGDSEPAASPVRIEYEDLLYRLTATCTMETPISGMLLCMLGSDTPDEEARHACELLTATAAIRDFHALHDDCAMQQQVIPEHVPEFEIDIARTLVKQEIETGVLQRYVAQGKLSLDHARLYSTAVGAMLDDLVAYRERRHFFEYYSSIDPAMTHEEYRANGRIRFEYVMQCATDRFVARILRLM